MVLGCHSSLFLSISVCFIICMLSRTSIGTFLYANWPGDGGVIIFKSGTQEKAFDFYFPSVWWDWRHDKTFSSQNIGLFLQVRCILAQIHWFLRLSRLTCPWNKMALKLPWRLSECNSESPFYIVSRQSCLWKCLMVSPWIWSERLCFDVIRFSGI